MAPTRPPLSSRQRQRGAIFLVMLVILIMGISITLIGALSKVTLQTARNEASADLLAQAKEVVIGYAVNNSTGGQKPGNVLRPDSFASTESPPNYDGTSETGCLDATKPAGLPLTTMTANMRCLGRLPWKEYQLSIDSPSENDPTGFMPWYAVSANLIDPGSVTFNSELLNSAPYPWLTVRDMNGNILSNRVAFIIIIPGPPIDGQSRPASPNLGSANQYLDSITVPATCTTPCVPGTFSNADMDNDFIMGRDHRWINDPANPGQQIDDPNYHFNDKLIYVTIDDLMPLIEKRIAREVKSCLDSYAATSGGKYPWAAPVSDTTTFSGSYGTLFGRAASAPNASTGGSNPAAVTLQNALNSLQAALDNYFAVGNSTNRAILINQGNYVISLKYSISSPPAPSGFSNTIDTAGDWAVEFAGGMHTYSGVSGKITTALNAVAPLVANNDSGMSTSWPPSCTIFSSAYWSDWQSLTFYQLANGYKPGTATPSCGASCLTINGSGNTNGNNGTYRAAVIIAGKMLAGQSPRNASLNPPTYYLEGVNPHDSTSATPATTFETYKVTDPSYSTVNDLVLCLDGKGINSNSVCQ